MDANPVLSQPEPSYRAYWGLQDSPFRGLPDPKFFYQSTTHEEALARLHFLVDDRRRLAILVGEQGSGKSMLLQVFARELRRKGRQVALLGLRGVCGPVLLWEMAAQFGLDPSPGDSLLRSWRVVVDRFVENRCQQIHTVILLDDAGNAEDDALSNVIQLAQADSVPESCLTFVLAADSDRCQRLGERLWDLCQWRVELERWEISDTVDYVASMLTKSGREQSPFAPPALTRLHELTDGLPRRVSQLADLALLEGANKRLDQIDEQTVETAHRELVESGKTPVAP